MTDRELLEAAAKAAGYKVGSGTVYGVQGFHMKDGLLCPNDLYWNPLTDDGDALRLAVKLKMEVQTNEASASVQTWQSDIGETNEVIEYFDPPQGSYAATRRAIVRAAAEIGK
jgi:hypothetical protein